MPQLLPFTELERGKLHLEEIGVKDGSSPNESFDLDSTTATRRFHCDWAERFNAVRCFVGDVSTYAGGGCTTPGRTPCCSGCTERALRGQRFGLAPAPPRTCDQGFRTDRPWVEIHNQSQPAPDDPHPTHLLCAAMAAAMAETPGAPAGAIAARALDVAEAVDAEAVRRGFYGREVIWGA